MGTAGKGGASLLPDRKGAFHAGMVELARAVVSYSSATTLDDVARGKCRSTAAGRAKLDALIVRTARM